jgi:plasmid maintenance system antidote protein VapI
VETKPEKVTLEKRILDVLKDKIGQEVSVKELAAILNTNERSLRRVLRKMRETMPDKFTCIRSAGKLTYVFGATPEQIEEIKKKFEAKKAPKRKKEAVTEVPIEGETKEVELLEEELPEEEEEEETEEKKVEKILEG